jgi:hypothetical protein
MIPLRSALAVAITLATAALPATARDSEVGSALRNPDNRQKLEKITTSKKESDSSDGRIRVTEGVCKDGMPTCYDGPTNTIFIAGDPTKYLYKTVPQPGQPSVFPYSWDRALYRDIQKAYLWWVEKKRDGVDTAAYDRENVLPLENEYFWRKRQEPHRLCGHSASECMELKATE